MRIRRTAATTETPTWTPRPRIIPNPRLRNGDNTEFIAALTAGGRVDPAQVQRILESDAVSKGRLLLEQAGVDDVTFTMACSRQHHLPVMDLLKFEPQPSAIALITGVQAHGHGALPLNFENGVLTVVMLDPLDTAALAFLESIEVEQINVTVAPAFAVAAALNASYPALAGVSTQLDAFSHSEIGRTIDLANEAANTVTFAGDDAPVIHVVNLIVTQALRDRASDVHIEPTLDAVRVRFRVDGALTEALSLPVNIGPALVSRLKIMADMNIVERRRPQDGQFQMNVDGREVDIRVATSATIWGEKMVLRLLDKRRALMRLADLGMPREAEQAFTSAATAPFGMVIVSGPTGSGKTTTLYATLSEINRPDLNVMTIEDPVEYVFPSINQIQINTQAEITFATGLKSILRQDPDVILVGEIRDAETARIAVQSALTGHLVLSSLHAVDSVSALYRLLDMGVESFLVASSVTTIVAQRLVRRICASCRTAYTPTPAERKLHEHFDGPLKEAYVKGAGCRLCNGTGFRGRTGVYETLTVTDELRECVLAHSPVREARALAIKQGLSTLQDEAVRLVYDDVTTIGEVMQKVFLSDTGASPW